MAESVIGLYKTELIKPRGPWKTVDDVEYATAEYIDWFNHRRLYEYWATSHPPNWRPPTTLNTRPGRRVRSYTSESPDSPG